MNAKEVIEKIRENRGDFKQVYWVACGGSLVDLIPCNAMVQANSLTLESAYYTAKEFILTTPRKLGADSLVILCSHSGGTKETLDAAELSLQKGAKVIMLTHNPESKAVRDEWVTWVYPWGENNKTEEMPSGILLSITAELIKSQEDFPIYDALMDALKKMDGIVENARIKLRAEICDKFVEMCKTHDFLYILGSGANFSQTYGFSICSLMEMQWQNCAYIHSGEYFHGPFEVTEPGVAYFLQKGSGRCRPMDERAEDFLKTHTDSLIVLDALEYGMDQVDESVRDYTESIMYYAMNCELRSARGKVFDHDPDVRRYMGIVKY